MRQVLNLLLAVIFVVLFFMVMKSCIDQERKSCNDRGGYYFRGHCIKDGKLID